MGKPIFAKAIVVTALGATGDRDLTRTTAIRPRYKDTFALYVFGYRSGAHSWTDELTEELLLNGSEDGTI